MTRPASFALATLLLGALVVPAQAEDTLVIAPAEWQRALGDWTEYRTRQGHTVTVEAPTEDIAAQIARSRERSKGALRFVMLVGAVDQIPTNYRDADIISQWEKDPRVATDAPYADLDGDGMPDLALGRLTADSVEETERMLARSIDYEEEAPGGMWQRRLQMIGGVAGFGQVQDLAIEALTGSFLHRDVPAAVDVSLTYAHPHSPFCPPPATITDVVRERVAEGALLLAYVGHGSRRALDQLQHGETKYPIFRAPDAKTLTAGRTPPLAVLIACSTGHLDGKDDCLAEELLHHGEGPIAVIASSRVSTPYGNGIVAKELLEALYVQRVTTVGEAHVATLRGLLTHYGSEQLPEDATRAQIERFARTYHEKDAGRRKREREEHARLYHLFGDPLLRVRVPAELSWSAPASHRLGTPLTLSGSSPVAGVVTLELVRRRDQIPRKAPDKTTEQFAADYAASNERTVHSESHEIASGDFAFDVEIPPEIEPGHYYVRAFVDDGARGAMGGSKLRLLRRR